jgi:hypothetical protein
MPRGWAYGASVVAGVHVLWLVLIYSGARADWFMPAIIVMFFVTLNIAGLGSFITAYLAHERWLLRSLSMAPLAAALATMSNAILELRGTHLDFSGYRGNLGLFSISLAYGLFVAVVGAGNGRGMRKRRAAPPAPITALPDSPPDPPPPRQEPPAGAAPD